MFERKLFCLVALLFFLSTISHAVFINWFLSRKGQIALQKHLDLYGEVPPTRAVSISRKKISRPKAGLSRGENISMSHGPNGRTWSRFSSWSKKSRPAGTRNR